MQGGGGGEKLSVCIFSGNAKWLSPSCTLCYKKVNKLSLKLNERNIKRILEPVFWSQLFHTAVIVIGQLMISIHFDPPSTQFTCAYTFVPET